MHYPLTLTLVLAVLLIGEAAAAKKCRCEAKYEDFYDRRRGLTSGDNSHRDLGGQDSYQYGGAYEDDEGYYVVDGVRVLPKSDSACDTRGHQNYFDNNRALSEISSSEINEEDEEEESTNETVLHQRTLKGMGMGHYSYDEDDYYYNNYNSKGSVR